ncbi:MAG: hypothetical protein JWL84_940 [Rhodospirillales bacterium]|nr:hypothetical protein [Rhodospirillales bacterium]
MRIPGDCHYGAVSAPEGARSPRLLSGVYPRRESRHFQQFFSTGLLTHPRETASAVPEDEASGDAAEVAMEGPPPQAARPHNGLNSLGLTFAKLHEDPAARGQNPR